VSTQKAQVNKVNYNNHMHSDSKKRRLPLRSNHTTFCCRWCEALCVDNIIL